MLCIYTVLSIDIHMYRISIEKYMCIKIANGPAIKFTNSNGKLFDRLSSVNRTTERMKTNEGMERKGLHMKI